MAGKAGKLAPNLSYLPLHIPTRLSGYAEQVFRSFNYLPRTLNCFSGLFSNFNTVLRHGTSRRHSSVESIASFSADCDKSQGQHDLPYWVTLARFHWEWEQIVTRIVFPFWEYCKRILPNRFWRMPQGWSYAHVSEGREGDSAPGLQKVPGKEFERTRRNVACGPGSSQHRSAKW